MSKNFKQLKGKFGRDTGYPFDPKQDPFRSDPTGNETYVTGSFFLQQIATGSFANGNSIYCSFYAAGGREGVDTYWRMYTVEDSGYITGFDSRSLIYPKPQNPKTPKPLKNDECSINHNKSNFH